MERLDALTIVGMNAWGCHPYVSSRSAPPQPESSDFNFPDWDSGQLSPSAVRGPVGSYTLTMVRDSSSVPGVKSVTGHLTLWIPGTRNDLEIPIADSTSFSARHWPPPRFPLMGASDIDLEAIGSTPGRSGLPRATVGCLRHPLPPPLFGIP